MISQGYSRQYVANFFGITTARVSQINSEHYTDLTDDGARDELRTHLESYLADVLHPMLRGPGRPLFANGSGKLVTDADGNVIYDEYAKVDVVNSALRVHERLTKLNALDRPKAREKDESGEIAEVREYFNTLSGRVQSLEGEKRELLAKLASYEAALPEAEVVSSLVDVATIDRAAFR